MGIRAIAAALLAGVLATAAPVDAGNRREAREQLESSLQLSGSITVDRQGTVVAHTLDPEAPLDDVLRQFVGKAVASWRFEPVVVDGEVVVAKVPMHLRLVARKADDDRINVSIASTYFGNEDDLPATHQPQSIRLAPPRYPKTALMMGGKGTVYLVVQVGRDGKVMNADAEQVNLRVIGNSQQMDVLRQQFTDAAIRAARGWTFAVPTTGEEAGKDSWLVRVPVDYVLTGPGEKKPRDGGWDTYIPGPRNFAMPWAAEQLRTAGSPDALPGSGVFPLRQGAKLLNPPAG